MRKDLLLLVAAVLCAVVSLWKQDGCKQILDQEDFRRMHEDAKVNCTEVMEQERMELEYDVMSSIMLRTVGMQNI